jgi:acetyl esterase/lipase
LGLEIDAEVAAALAGGTALVVARDDWSALRAGREAVLAARAGHLPNIDSVERTDYVCRSYDDAEIMVRWFQPRDRPAEPGPALVYLHGGGMILGSVELYDRRIAAYAEDGEVPILAVDYRLAPESVYPTPVEDCFAGLTWLLAHAEELNVSPTRVAVMGDSSGGGLAAGVAILARNRGVRLARQILVYPMLDDRTTVSDAVLAPFALWTYDENYTGWHALLGDLIGSAHVPGDAAPAREQVMSELADAYLEVGELDIFRDEVIEYARRLSREGVCAELHVHPGCPHGFDSLAPQSRVARRARADRIRVIRSV